MTAPGRLRLLTIVFVLVAGCGAAMAASNPDPLQLPDSALEPLGWGALDGWSSDDHAAAFAVFLASCRPLLKGAKPIPETKSMSEALAAVCRRASAAGRLNAEQARKFFERNFRPNHVARLSESLGLLTGYYEPIVDGSRFPTREFTVPIYRRPDDLVMLMAHREGEGFPNRGDVGRRVGDEVVGTYFDRAEIENGALDGRHLEICWIRDHIDALFIQIQGSARIRLEDGLLLRINYDAHNGLPFTPVGRPLIERNIIPKEEMSMARIRKWMLANPEEAREVRQTNRSFVFFRITGLGDAGEPAGGQGVRLTPGRSIAVDKSLHAYGTPFFIEADLPIAGDRPTTRFRRLMIAQDTGSAIVGPARADVFFGAGEDAGRVAGRIKQMGRFAILVPREIDPAAAAAHMPLPRAKPKIEEPIVPLPLPLPLPRPRPELEAEPKLAVGVPGHSGQESAGEPSAEPNTGVVHRRRTVR
jgi:membrane-bound lytic murein transglycosylase A